MKYFTSNYYEAREISARKTNESSKGLLKFNATGLLLTCTVTNQGLIFLTSYLVLVLVFKNLRVWKFLRNFGERKRCISLYTEKVELKSTLIERLLY